MYEITKCFGLTGRSKKKRGFIGIRVFSKIFTFLDLISVFLQIKTLNQWTFDPKKWFPSAQILTFEDKINPLKNIVPPRTEINQNRNDVEQTLDDLNIGEEYEFIREEKRIIHPFQPDEENPDQMKFVDDWVNSFDVCFSILKRMKSSSWIWTNGRTWIHLKIFKFFVNDRELKLENFSGVIEKKMTIRAEEFQQNFRLCVYKKKCDENDCSRSRS